MSRPKNRFHWLLLNIRRYVPVTHYMAISQAKKEFAGTLGGLLWWIVEPVFYCFVYYFVFAIVFESKTENYISFLLLGLVTWRWFTSMTQAAGDSITTSSSLMRQVDIPKVVFPIKAVIVESYKYLVALVVVCALLMFLGQFSYSTAYLFPVVFIVSFIFFLGSGLVLSALMPFFPDLKKFVTLGFRGLMFLSGVFFEASRIPEVYRIYFYLNPLSTLIEGFRDTLFFGRVPDFAALSVVLACSLVLCVVGLYMHWRYNRIFPRYLV